MSASEMFLGFSRFAAACFRFSLAGCQLPSSGGNVAVGRWPLTFSERNLDLGLARFIVAALWSYLEAAASRRSLLFISMRTNTLLTRCKQRAVRYLAMRTTSIDNLAIPVNVDKRLAEKRGEH